MKRIIILSLIFLTLGIILGTKIYSATSSLENVFAEGTICYFLQEGVYSNEEIMQENTDSIKIKLHEQIDDKNYVYVGITKDIDNAKKLKRIYLEKGYDIYIKEQRITNEEFLSNLTQFDLLLNSTNDTEEILKITEVIFANYEEIIKKQ